ncbi:reverse transcriptase zinc-binding domain-containing protein, partial [Tanacetum coccineum]
MKKKYALFDIEDDKALSPDGFASKNFNVSWNIVGQEVCRALQESFTNGRLLGEDMIKKWRTNDALECALCKQDDSHEHLFFNCANFTKLHASNIIWNVVRRLVIVVVVYSVRKERTARLFSESKRIEDEIIQMIIETIKKKMMSLRVKDTLALKKVEKNWTINLKRIKKWIALCR